MHKSKITDEELWHAVVHNDSRAFAVLYNRHWKKLYNTAEHYLRDPGTAELIVHNVFVVLWKRREHLNIENFANYIYVTTRYHVYKELKAKKISPVEYIENYDNIANENTFNTGEEKLNYKDFESQLAECLKPLPKRCREIFWLSRMENLSNEEIANKLGISKRTVENQITHALKHLRDFLKDNSSIALSILWVTMWY